MKVSVITVVYNGEKTIQSCIDSVLGQDYCNLEYIIVDGASKDGTLSIIKTYEGRIHEVISEPDKGIYDAMNKGISAATGDIIGILNADDWYAGSTVLSTIAKIFQQTNCDATYSDLVYVDGDNPEKVHREWISGEYKDGAFLNGWMPPHPTFFVKRQLYDSLGLFRLDMGSAADYELMLRFIHKSKIKLSYIAEVLVRMRAGGVSNNSIGNRIAANQMDRKAWVVNGIKPRFYTLWAKPFRKLTQFIRI